MTSDDAYIKLIDIPADPGDFAGDPGWSQVRGAIQFDAGDFHRRFEDTPLPAYGVRFVVKTEARSWSMLALGDGRRMAIYVA
jgi:hypothetical protein